MTDEKIIQALQQADDLAINEEVDCSDVLKCIEDLRNKNKALDAHNAISTLLDATRKLLEQGSSKGGVWIKTGDLNDTYSILIQKDGLGRPIDALNAKIDSLSVELGQAKAYIDRLKEACNEAIRSFTRMETLYKLKCNEIKTVKAKTVREFAEKVKENLEEIFDLAVRKNWGSAYEYINELVKEVCGE